MLIQVRQYVGDSDNLPQPYFINPDTVCRVLPRDAKSCMVEYANGKVDRLPMEDACTIPGVKDIVNKPDVELK